jgi:hypothetical protein
MYLHPSSLIGFILKCNTCKDDFGSFKSNAIWLAPSAPILLFDNIKRVIQLGDLNNAFAKDFTPVHPILLCDTST